MHITSKAGLDLIKRFESLRLKAYKDEGGVWTIGYGHTGPDVNEGLEITEDRADYLLKLDVGKIETAFSKLFKGFLITQGEFDAFVSFAFNVGLGAFACSTLFKKFKESDERSETPEQFGRWIYVKKRISLGLIKRRIAEIILYLS